MENELSTEGKGLVLYKPQNPLRFLERLGVAIGLYGDQIPVYSLEEPVQPKSLLDGEKGRIVVEDSTAFGEGTLSRVGRKKIITSEYSPSNSRRTEFILTVPLHTSDFESAISAIREEAKGFEDKGFQDEKPKAHYQSPEYLRREYLFSKGGSRIWIYLSGSRDDGVEEIDDFRKRAGPDHIHFEEFPNENGFFDYVHNSLTVSFESENGKGFDELHDIAFRYIQRAIGGINRLVIEPYFLVNPKDTKKFIQAATNSLGQPRKLLAGDNDRDLRNVHALYTRKEIIDGNDVYKMLIIQTAMFDVKPVTEQQAMSDEYYFNLRSIAASQALATTYRKDEQYKYMQPQFSVSVAFPIPISPQLAWRYFGRKVDLGEF